MKKYKVDIPYVMTVSAIIEVMEEELESNGIEDENDIKDFAIDKAIECVNVQSFCGNGGVDKLIGVLGQNVSINCCGEPLDGENYNFVIEVGEIKE